MTQFTVAAQVLCYHFMMKILQITDPHLYGSAAGRLRGVETDSSLRTVLEDAFARVPDYSAVLVTGDLVQDDTAGYLRFRSIFGNLKKPVLCIPGNHDEPEAMRRELAGAPFQICGTHAAEGWQFIMLDSYDPGHVGGRLTVRELARLDAALERSPLHAMVCLHHHPVAMGSRWLDTVGLAQPDEFWRVIDKHAHVRAVVWGHVHQVYDGQRGNVRLFATPSTGAQFLPKSDRYAVDSLPPAYRHFELHTDGRIETTVHWIDSQPMCQSLAR
ncbi:MAG TPA: metallophosphoesterase [Steroidobacteraceae bacterium]|nr:metallophosphoesterase [Steroidobacteraceae bacterium]